MKIVCYSYIRYNIYKQTNDIIGNQNLDTLKNIMRSIFLKYSKNNKNNIKSQIYDLDKIVIDYCINEIKGSIISYKKYMEEDFKDMSFKY